MPTRFTKREIQTVHDNLAVLAAHDPELWRIVSKFVGILVVEVTKRRTRRR